jgi:hypothetical protein
MINEETALRDLKDCKLVLLKEEEGDESPSKAPNETVKKDFEVALMEIKIECYLAGSLDTAEDGNVYRAMSFCIETLQELAGCDHPRLDFPAVDEEWDGASLSLYAKSKLEKIVKVWKENPQ